MQNAKAVRRWADNDKPEGGGPAGASGVSPTQAEDDRIIRALYLKGAAARFVLAQIELGVAIARRLREGGLIETRQDVKGRTEAKLTARALQRLVGGLGPSAALAPAL